MTNVGKGRGCFILFFYCHYFPLQAATFQFIICKPLQKIEPTWLVVVPRETERPQMLNSELSQSVRA